MAEQDAGERARAQDHGQHEQQPPTTAANRATVPASRRCASVGVQLVVDAEEAGVEAQAEDDLGHRPEQEQQREVPVVGRA